MSDLYDVIVVGVGSMGSATCYELAKRGVRVLGLEQFSSPHEQGSHTGQSRIIRKAYFEHPDYVPLLNRAYRKWEELQVHTGQNVFYKTGLVYYGPPDSQVILGTREAARLHSLQLDSPAPAFTQFRIPPEFNSLLEKDAGFLRPERSIELFIDEARKQNATIKNYETVKSWQSKNGSITVNTTENSYHTKKLVITAGAWTQKLVGDLVPLKITRQLVIWVDPPNKEQFIHLRFPCWLIADQNRAGSLYGFPYLDEKTFGPPAGIKFAWHHPASVTDPDSVNRKIEQTEINELISWVSEYIPATRAAKVLAAKTCLYANSADENFILDHLPGHDKNVVIAGGFSGHGFKFVSVIGEILADLALDGRTKLPIEFLSLNRFIQ